MILLTLMHKIAVGKPLKIHHKDGGDRRHKASKPISLELLDQSALSLLMLPSSLLQRATYVLITSLSRMTTVEWLKLDILQNLNPSFMWSLRGYLLLFRSCKL